MNQIKAFIEKLNSAGIPIPLVKLNGRPTFTGTLTLLSFGTALLGQIGKLSKLLGDVDLTQANYLFLICLGAYLGRRMQGSGQSASLDTTINKEEDNK